MKLLLFCPNSKPYLWKYDKEYAEYLRSLGNHNSNFEIGNMVSKNEPTYENCKEYVDKVTKLNGKIVAECDFEIEYISVQNEVEYSDNEEIISEFLSYYTKQCDFNLLLNKAAISFEQLDDYLCHCGGYAIHIKNLHIFENPRDLEEFNLTNNCCFEKEVGRDWEDLPIFECKFHNCCRYKSDCANVCDKHFYEIKRIRNITKVFDTEDIGWKFAMSVKSEQLCKLLNGKATTIIKKSISKEMKSFL